jgi:hypothetical protein
MSDRPDLHGIDDGSGGGPAGTGGVEQRLRTQLGRHAADATVPEHGLDAIRGRIQRRRRNRQLLVGGSSLAIVLVLLAGALAIARPADDQSYVGTDDGTMPLLGWSEGTFEVPGVRAGWDYFGTWLPPGGGDERETVNLTVTRTGIVTLTPDEGGEPTSAAGRPARLFHDPSGDDEQMPDYSAIVWEPGPGWAATLYVGFTHDESDALSTQEKEALLTRAARAVRPISPEDFGEAVDRAYGDDLARSALVFAADEGRSVARSVQGRTIIAIAADPAAPRITELCFGPDVFPTWGPNGEPVVVRGRDGTTEHLRMDGPELRSTPSTEYGPEGLRLVSWQEGDLVYRLIVDGSVSATDAVAIADAMHTPTGDEWGQLFVAAEPPRRASRLYC